MGVLVGLTLIAFFWGVGLLAGRDGPFPALNEEGMEAEELAGDFAHSPRLVWDHRDPSGHGG